MGESQVIEYSTTDYNTRQPDQYLTEDQKFGDKAKYFYDNLSYIGSFYNRYTGNVALPFNEQMTPLPIQKMLTNMMYYLGEQPNLTYAYMTQNVDLNNLQLPWRKGQDMFPLIEKMRGNMSRILNAIHFSCRPLSEKAQSRRSDYYNKIMLEWELAKNGIPVSEFSPSRLSELSQRSQEEMQKYVDGRYKDAGANFMINLAKAGWNTQSLMTYVRAYLWGRICGWAGIEHYVDNGRHMKKVHLPYQMIVDTRIDDDLNREARFVGTITSMTPTEIFHTYPYLTQKQRIEIQNMANSAELFRKYNTATNFSWWNYNTGNQDATATMIRGYWISPRFMDAREITNEYGVAQMGDSAVEWNLETKELTFTKDSQKNTIGNVTEKNLGNYLDRSEADNLTSQSTEVRKTQSTKYVIDEVYKADLIGNRYMLNFGYSTNVVEHPFMKYKPLLPIQVWTPNMVAGKIKSVPDRLSELQDEIDAYGEKIKEIVARGKGKVAVFYGWKFGDSTTVKEILEDISNQGITVIKSSGEVLPEAAEGKIGEVYDMTLDQNFIGLENLRVARKNEMKEIMAESAASLGQVSNYIGGNAVQNSIEQSSLGQATVLDGFLEYVQTNVQYECNVKKTLFVENPDSFDAAMVVGDEGVEYFRKVLPDLKFEDFLLNINIKDIMDEKAKERIQAIQQAYAQNAKDPIATAKAVLQILKIDRASSYTEAITELTDYLQVEVRMADKKMAEAAQQEQQLAAAQMQQAEMLKLQDIVGKLLTKLTEIDRTGQWDVLQAAVTKGLENQPPPIPPIQQPIQQVSNMLAPSQ